MRTLVSTALLLLAPAALGQVSAQKPEDARQPLMLLRFVGGSLQENFASVVVELARRGVLDHVTYVDKEGETPGKILQKAGSLAGTTVPFELEQYLCEINPHVCRVLVDGRKLDWRNRKAPGAVEEKADTCGPTRLVPMEKWLERENSETLPPHVLCLPRLDVRRYQTTAAIPYTRGKDDLREILRTRGACDPDAKSCRELVDVFNRSALDGKSAFDAPYSGSLRIPVWGYSFAVPVADRDGAAKLAGTLDEVIARQQADGKFAKLQKSNISYSLSLGQLKPQSLYAVDHNLDDASVRRQMNIPTTRPSPEVGQVFIGVWDDYVDHEHCVFHATNKQSPIVALEPDTQPGSSRTGLTIPARGACGATRNYFSKPIDHATHIVALIAGRHAPQVVAGINSQASIWAYEIGDGTRLERDADPIGRITRVQGREPRVINISRAQPAAGTVRTVLESYISEYDGDVLFVAAAGGSDGNGVHVASSFQCRILPACLSVDPATRDKVISVVAVNTDLKRLSGAPQENERVLGETTPPAARNYSNWGPVFDVAAIGVARSAIYGNYVGVADGTSIAAPYVTALASMLTGQHTGPRGRPKAVKRRILYTADFSSELDQVVAWGLINFDRALRSDADTIQIRPNHCDSQTNCTWSRPVSAATTKPLILKSALIDGKPVAQGTSVPFLNVRRIARAAEGTDVFYLVTETDAGLTKYTNTEFEGNPVLSFADLLQPRAKGLVDIEDFTARMPR